jgi:hypothetical protein
VQLLHEKAACKMLVKLTPGFEPGAKESHQSKRQIFHHFWVEVEFSPSSIICF